MDPEETLKRARWLAERIQRVRDADSVETLDEDDAFDLAEAFQALDEWLKNGGFPPAEWHHPAAHLKQSEEGH